MDILVLKLHPDDPKAAPRLIAAPQAQTAVPGSTVAFGVRALGMGRLSYQWRYNSKPIAGATGATLTLSAVQSTNAGGYSVEVSDRVGSVVTAEARLHVFTVGRGTPPREHKQVELGRGPGCRGRGRVC